MRSSRMPALVSGLHLGLRRLQLVAIERFSSADVRPSPAISFNMVTGQRLCW